jgi:hypothetical protein
VLDVFHIPVRYNLREGDQFQGVFLHGIPVEQLLVAALMAASIQVMSETVESA